MAMVRAAAVAGMFYPGTARALDAAVRGYLAAATTTGPVPKAIIAPHAGYDYSGAIAATAYARLAPARGRIQRVVLLGPCHRVPVRGLAVSGAQAFATPLGQVPLDRDAVAAILELPQVRVFDATHGQEHSLEVHLPFLQVALERFTIVPLVVGDAITEEVAQVIDRLWDGPETLIVVSSDLSHYLDYESARKLDRATCAAIEALDGDRIGRDQACGRIPIKGLLALARRHGLRVDTIDLRNSGDTAGPRDRVVGYGSWLFFENVVQHSKDAGAMPGAMAAGAQDRDPTTAETKGDGRPVPGEAPPDAESAFRHQTQVVVDGHGRELIQIADASIRHGLAHDVPLAVDPERQPAALREHGAAFVTLRRDRQLRGCIGSLRAHRPLAVDVAENAFAAAFRDPRFKPLTGAELTDLDVSLSLLSPAWPLRLANEADLLDQLRPGIDGLIIEDQGRRALFLPSVWQSLPEPKTFLDHLRRKARLAPGHWSATFRAWRFIAVEIAADALGRPA